MHTADSLLLLTFLISCLVALLDADKCLVRVFMISLVEMFGLSNDEAAGLVQREFRNNSVSRRGGGEQIRKRSITFSKSGRLSAETVEMNRSEG